MRYCDFTTVESFIKYKRFYKNRDNTNVIQMCDPGPQNQSFEIEIYT